MVYTLRISNEELKRLIADGVSMSQISRQTGHDRHTIGRVLDSLGVDRPPKHSCPGKKNPMWKGGVITDKDGYRLIYMPGHPNSSKTGKGRAGYVREHRLVMEAVLGRYLDPSEVVHHIDGNKLNNTPSNLELFSKNSDHLAKTLKGKRPQWTDDGKARIKEGVLKAIQSNKGRHQSEQERLNRRIAQLRRHGKI